MIGQPRVGVDRSLGRWLAGGGLVKICGVRRPADAMTAAAAGADLIGFIFAPARRRVAPEVAREAIAAAKGAVSEGGPLAVGVFVDATSDEMNRVADIAGLDLLQLHGQESPASLLNLERPVIKAFRPRAGASVQALDDEIAPFHSMRIPPVAFLIDGFSERAAGGEGIRADWQLAAEVSRRLPVMLAGGLNAAIVGDAIRLVDPLGVDVSSGVETDGAKDPILIETFVRVAKAAFARRQLAPAAPIGPETRSATG